MRTSRPHSTAPRHQLLPAVRGEAQVQRGLGKAAQLPLGACRERGEGRKEGRMTRGEQGRAVAGWSGAGVPAGWHVCPKPSQTQAVCPPRTPAVGQLGPGSAGQAQTVALQEGDRGTQRDAAPPPPIRPAPTSAQRPLPGLALAIAKRPAPTLAWQPPPPMAQHPPTLTPSGDLRSSTLASAPDPATFSRLSRR